MPDDRNSDYLKWQRPIANALFYAWSLSPSCNPRLFIYTFLNGGLPFLLPRFFFCLIHFSHQFSTGSLVQALEPRSH